MILDKRDFFSLEKLKRQGPKAVFEKYLQEAKNIEGACPRTLPYAKLFVNFEPFVCERILRDYRHETFSLEPWGVEYIFLISYIAAIHLDNEEIQEGLIWATKAINALDYFVPGLHGEIRDKEIQGMGALTMIRDFLPVFNENDCNRFKLDWENKADFHANDN